MIILMMVCSTILAKKMLKNTSPDYSAQGNA